MYYASVSGGKDSTALCLHLQELGIPYQAVHLDTGWEHPSTMRYVREELPKYVGPIRIESREPELDEEREALAQEGERMLGFRSPMIRWILHKAMFSSRRRRWCTQELKVWTIRDVMRQAIADGEAPINVVGIRAAESRARARLKEHELMPALDCMVWRPILRWTMRDVREIHRRHGVTPNPLYLRGSTRVGCWPCVMAGKAELRLLDESRIRVIEWLEQVVGELARKRNPDRPKPAFFQAQSNVQDPTGQGGRPCIPIRRMVEWAHTARGGKEPERQLGLPGLNAGCLSFGLCEAGTTK